jgi:hypothetical protein
MSDETITSKLIHVLPKLKTPLQLGGFVIIVCSAVAATQASATTVKSVIAIGTLGIAAVFFGFFFGKIECIPPRDRSRTVVILFISFLVVMLVLSVAAILTRPHTTSASTQNLGGSSEPKGGINAKSDNETSANRSQGALSPSVVVDGDVFEPLEDPYTPPDLSKKRAIVIRPGGAWSSSLVHGWLWLSQDEVSLKRGDIINFELKLRPENKYIGVLQHLEDGKSLEESAANVRNVVWIPIQSNASNIIQIAVRSPVEVYGFMIVPSDGISQFTAITVYK